MATWLSAEPSLTRSRLAVSMLVGSFRRSSYSCRFFVLPCCFFDFVGRHCRRQSGKTQYRGYLDFVSDVGSACGFRVEEDCLRIPSTRRVRPAPARSVGGAGGGGPGRGHGRPQRLRARVFQTAPGPIRPLPLGVRGRLSVQPPPLETFRRFLLRAALWEPSPSPHLLSRNRVAQGPPQRRRQPDL